jgi:hypothetical protein
MVIGPKILELEAAFFKVWRRDNVENHVSDFQNVENYKMSKITDIVDFSFAPILTVPCRGRVPTVGVRWC